MDNLLIGIVLPPLIDVVGKDVSNDKARFVIAILISLATAIVIDWPKVQSGNLFSLLQTAGIVFAEAQTVFNLYWKDSLLRDKLQTNVAKVKVVSEVTPFGEPKEVAPAVPEGRTNY